MDYVVTGILESTENKPKRQDLDVMFLCGPKKEPVKTNRACLASTNLVLKHILYGTESIIVDLAKPIIWPDFESGAVCMIFEALMSQVVIPLMPYTANAEMLLDYLCETDESLNVYFETEFERKTEVKGEFRVIRVISDGITKNIATSLVGR